MSSLIQLGLYKKVQSVMRKIILNCLMLFLYLSRVLPALSFEMNSSTDASFFLFFFFVFLFYLPAFLRGNQEFPPVGNYPFPPKVIYHTEDVSTFGVACGKFESWIFGKMIRFLKNGLRNKNQR